MAHGALVVGVRVFEDFVPVSGMQALVTTGDRLTELDQLELVQYRMIGDRVEVSDVRGEILHTGKHLRLGGLCGSGEEERLVFSDKGRGVVGAKVESVTAHQPFVYQGKVYYTDDWPDVRIYCDGKLFIDHFAGYVQVGNPHWGNGTLFFEARRNNDPKHPERWEVWKRQGEISTLIGYGANPAYWNGWLYYGVWNGRGFDYRRVEVG